MELEAQLGELQRQIDAAKKQNLEAEDLLKEGLKKGESDQRARNFWQATEMPSLRY